jgi:Asp-tRNA(Asn)/Glu-tRNA(Gln) amidotransferase A subunit family amidase
MDRISGSGVFARDPDSVLIMTKHEQEDTYTVEATLRNLKPIGLQLLGKPLDEARLLQIAHAYEQSTDCHRARPSGL